MALIQCPECGADISDKATECPKCGCPVESSAKTGTTKKKVFSTKVMILILAFLFIVVANLLTDPIIAAFIMVLIGE